MFVRKKRFDAELRELNRAIDALQGQLNDLRRESGREPEFHFSNGPQSTSSIGMREAIGMILEQLGMRFKTTPRKTVLETWPFRSSE